MKRWAACLAGACAGVVTLFIACQDCGAIQELPPPPERGHLECWRCACVLERRTGRSLDAALACAVATLLLLLPANLMIIMTVHVAGIDISTHLASGLGTAFVQGYPLLALVLGLEAVALPLVRFGLLAGTLAAIRFGARGPAVGAAFRWSEKLDIWAMADVLLIGAGIGYGRVVSQIPVTIDPGGWCLVGAALMTMVTRASLDRRAVWRRLETPVHEPDPDAVACTSCDLVLPASAEGTRCPRCLALVHRRRPHALIQCAALSLATWALMPIAYGFPVSALWKLGTIQPHTIIDGVILLYENNFIEFAVLIFAVSIMIPFTKLGGLTWFVVSVLRHSPNRLKRKTRLYRFIDEAGRWSTLDPFTVIIFAPMVQMQQLAHIAVMGGAPAFLATVVLSMLATRSFDPRLMWDAAADQPAESARISGVLPAVPNPGG